MIAFFSTQKNVGGDHNVVTLSLSSLVSKILFNFLDSGLFGWDSLPSAILEIFLRGYALAHTTLRLPLDYCLFMKRFTASCVALIREVFG